MTSLGIILTPDIRSKAYLKKILDNNFLLNEIIFMNDCRKEKIYSQEIVEKSKIYGFNISVSIKKILEDNKLKFKEFNFVDINHPELISFLKRSKTKFFIFTGGGILRKDVLNAGPKFIHLHPGIVPEYRGSTCFYYSILNENKCGVTAFIMEEGLDTGKIIYQKTFEKPDHQYVDEIYDPYIRSETLIEILKKDLIEKENFTEQDLAESETYYIIHPVLKHIAILSCIKQ